jgi:predicted phage-related endonuclease
LDVEKVIHELLDQNKKLRMELAVLTAQKKLQDEIDRQMEESQKGITPEVLAQLSPAARKALETMRFE